MEDEMLCLDCKQNPAIEIHTPCCSCLGKRPYVREPRDFTPAPRPTGDPMEFRTKREAEEAARRQDGDAEGHISDAEWHKDRGFQSEAIRARRAAADCRAEAARIRAMLPNLPEK